VGRIKRWWEWRRTRSEPARPEIICRPPVLALAGRVTRNQGVPVAGEPHTHTGTSRSQLGGRPVLV
jgi:hypothetical protein